MSPNPRRILFIAEGQLGDLLLLTPAIRAMKQMYPTASVSILILERRKSAPFSTNSPISRQSNTVFDGNPNVDCTYILNREALRSLGGWNRMKAEWEVVKFLRGQNPDVVICTFPQDRFVLWALATGARIRVGQRGKGLGWALTHRVETRKQDRGVLEHYCDLVREVGAKVSSLQTEYVIPTSATAWADAFLREHKLDSSSMLIAVHPGATGDYKIWPPERYAMLIDELQSIGNARVVLCQGVLDTPIIDAIRKCLRNDAVVAQTGEDLAQLAALLQRCALCISNDSGPRHLAIAVGTPSLALFRQHHDKEWKVYEESDRAATLQGSTRCTL
ncbi:MAG: lipopolysaccharide heptosyltransferase, partial [Bacteroidetes bacterium]|nr:lipopolysaccharide heptosyltransferase [Bacteroidota bacterium]